METGSWGPGSNPAPCIGSTGVLARKSLALLFQSGESSLPTGKSMTSQKSQLSSCLYVISGAAPETYQPHRTQHQCQGCGMEMSRRKRATKKSYLSDLNVFLKCSPPLSPPTMGGFLIQGWLNPQMQIPRVYIII